jgi:hypothetical protein
MTTNAMPNNSLTPAKQPSAAVNLNDRAVKSLADSIYKHLQDEGCQTKDIINISSQLLGLLTDQISDVNQTGR